MQLVHFPLSFARMARAGMALVMLALALLTSARPAAAASASVQPLGSGFQFHAKNAVAVTWDIAVSPSPIAFIGSTPVFPTGADVTRANTSFLQTTFDPFIGGLLPNTTYNYIVRAGSDYTTGSIKSLQRSVVVTFNSITVSNDSDDLGKGELTYQFKVNGVYRSALDFFRATSSGETFNPNRSVSGLINGGKTIPLAVEVQDDDCDFSTCVRPADFTSGSDSDNDWATAVATIRFTTDQSNSFSKTVSYSVSKAVGFNGTALVQVLYF
jgi:hypothetical protein